MRNTEDKIVKALELGANDYLTKPFRASELLARIRVAVCQSEGISEKQVLEFGSLTINLANQTASRNNEIIKLTSTEYSLLTLLAKNECRVLTHQYILKEIWGMGYLTQTQYLKIFIDRLRKKTEEDPAKPRLLNTESGIGYRFGF